MLGPRVCPQYSNEDTGFSQNGHTGVVNVIIAGGFAMPYVFIATVAASASATEHNYNALFVTRNATISSHCVRDASLTGFSGQNFVIPSLGQFEMGNAKMTAAFGELVRSHPRPTSDCSCPVVRDPHLFLTTHDSRVAPRQTPLVSCTGSISPRAKCA